MSSTATITRTIAVADLNWQATERAMNNWQHLEFAVSGSEEFVVDFNIDDLDHPSVGTAAFTYCG